MNLKFTLKSLLELLMYSSLFIGLSAVALVMATYLILGLPLTSISPLFLAVIFFSTLFIYNLNIFSISNLNPNPSSAEVWKLKNHKLIKGILFVSFVFICVGLSYFSFKSLLLIAHLALLSFLYVNPVKVNGKVISLRKLPFLKIFVLSYVWTAVTVLLPTFQFDLCDFKETISLLMERFLFIFALAIPFDIRDYSTDKKSGLITIPGTIGVFGAILLAKIALIGFVMYSLTFQGVTYISITRVLSALIAFGFLQRADQKKNDFFYLVGVDGLMIVHFLLLYIVYGFKESATFTAVITTYFG